MGHEQQEATEPKGTEGALTSANLLQEKSPSWSQCCWLAISWACEQNLSHPCPTDCSHLPGNTQTLICPTSSHLRGFEEWPNAPGLIYLGGKNPFHVWWGTNGCSKALGPLATSLHSISYDCCPRFARGWEWPALQWSSRRHSLGLATAIKLKRSDSLGHLQGLVDHLISWGACHLMEMIVTDWEFSSLLLLPLQPLVPLKLAAQLLCLTQPLAILINYVKHSSATG